MYRLITPTRTLTDEEEQGRFIIQASTPNPKALQILKNKRPVPLEFVPVIPKVAQWQRNDPDEGWTDTNSVYRVADFVLQDTKFPDSSNSLIFQVLVARSSSILVQLAISHSLSDIKTKLSGQISSTERRELLMEEQHIIYNYQSYLAQQFGRRS